ncbi:MAG: methyl-accepting chemotaxis protein [Microcoleaceae cyanobacterium]
MALSVNFRQEYEQTEKAYTDGDYERAAALVYQLVEEYPEDPSARLLCGHIYGYGLQQYDVAKQQYLAVLDLTVDPELVELAHQSIEATDQFIIDSDLILSGGSEDDLERDIYSFPLDDTAGLHGSGEDDPLDEAVVETFLESSEFEELNGVSQGLVDEEAELNSLLDDLPEPDLADIGLEDDFDLEELNSSATASDNFGRVEADLDPEVLELNSRDLDFANAGEDSDLENMPELDLQEWGLEDDLSLEEELDLSLGQVNAVQQKAVANPFGAELDWSEPELPDHLESEDLADEVSNFHTQLELPRLDHAEEFEAEDDDFSLSADQLLAELNLSGNLIEEDALDQADDRYSSFRAELNLGEVDLEAEHLFSSRDLPSEESPQVPSPVPLSTVASAEDDLDEIFAALDTPLNLDLDAEFDAEVPYTNNNGKSRATEPDLNFEMGSLEGDFDPAPPNSAIETLSLGSPLAQGRQTSQGSLDEDFVFEDEIPDTFEFAAVGQDRLPNVFEFEEEEAQNESEGAFGGALELIEDSDFSAGFNIPQPEKATGSVDSDFLNDFEEFEDFSEEGLDNFAAFDDETSEVLISDDTSGFDEEDIDIDGAFIASSSSVGQDSSAITNDDLFNPVTDREAISSFAASGDEPIETMLTVEQGPFAAFLENVPLKTKFFYTAIGTGIASLIFVAVTFWAYADMAARRQDREVFYQVRNAGIVMTFVAGVTGFLTTWGLGSIASRQVTKATNNLQTQFDAIAHNNLKARATVYATDEFGQMAAKFNHMAQFVETTTYEAQHKAEEQEESKENLQRQVIRLLDDVEGAARGDLTVSAEVTADVLGAVADSFNLTIQNLREIVVQVKQAARQVSRGATDSSTFAKDVAGDALRQAEELAATLNSVQVLTDAIQRVADSAREAEEVARSAAAVATKGGESVQLTVAGILNIRETVAETTREVKRLAESSQEISKIVAIISQIASRTNLLALNASIEAARAGEAGRGFAIVADEVRQLADRSAKSLKEIEQIVMQIQSQTSSVMMAMEEGNQQVIEGTRLAEQAKRSLDDIIQVTNRIDVLVRSITADTVEQNETARAVANVMQTVEHSAQETSQEAHRVSSALSNLVGVARDMLTSVERFRVDATDRK